MAMVTDNPMSNGSTRGVIRQFTMNYPIEFSRTGITMEHGTRGSSRRINTTLGPSLCIQRISMAMETRIGRSGRRWHRAKAAGPSNSEEVLGSSPCRLSGESDANRRIQ